jgi:N-methylhydantoinase A
MSNAVRRRPASVGVDVGGTFTDVAAFDERTGVITRAKAHTTPDQVVHGQVAAIRALALETHEIGTVLNGTTVVTNALLTRTGRATAMLMTAGFEDVLETGRERRVGGGLHMYDLRQAGPRALAPRSHRFGVRERLAADGRVLVPLDEAQVRGIAARLREMEVGVVAVCLLFSYLQPAHERRLREVLLQETPGLTVVLSSDVAPEMREYERASTTFIEAFTRDAFLAYLQGLNAELAKVANAPDVYVIQSNGGLVPADPQRVKPVHIVESGPAAGAVAAAFVSGLAGYRDIIAFDVGGTTAKACLLRDGRPGMTAEFKVEGYYPVSAASVDLVEIGTGGGSIAWIDAGGALRVGPRSAGARPGPAAYAAGGTEPTLTDANLVLGRLDPGQFLGGAFRLDPALAAAAIEQRIAAPLGLSVTAAAEGILEIANTQMAAAIQLISTRKGFDPRDFVLVAYGGAAALQAAEIAREVGVRRILVPDGCATLSALGLLVADLQADGARTFLSAEPADRADAIEAAFLELEAEAGGRIARGDDPGLQVRRFVDVRYVGQRWELTVPVAAGAFSRTTWGQAVEDFHAAHQRAYRFNDPAAAVELIKLRVEARIAMPHPVLRPEPLVSRGAPAPRGREDLPCKGRTIACAMYRRADLSPGHAINGPAVVHDADTTIWVPGGMRASMDGYRNLLIEETTA